MRKHLPSLAAAALSLAVFGCLTAFAVPSALAIAGWFAFGTVIAGYAGSLLYDYEFRIDTYAVGLCSGALLAGAAVKLAQHEVHGAKPTQQIGCAVNSASTCQGSQLKLAFRTDNSSASATVSVQSSDLSQARYGQVYILKPKPPSYI